MRMLAQKLPRAIRRTWLRAITSTIGLASAACNPSAPTPDLFDPADPAADVQPSTIHAGDYNGVLPFDDADRTFILRVPPRHNGQTPLPLVIMLHGGFGSAVNAARDYHWPAKADAEGFYAVFPDGLGAVQTWNATHCCGFARRNNVNDVGFIRALVAGLRNVLPIDTRMVFATGMSNGAMLAHRLGAEAADVFAAIAPVAGAIGGQVDANSPVVTPATPGGPVSVILFHGTADMSVLYDGGASQSPVADGRIDLAVDDAVQFWVSANQTTTAPVTTTSASGNVIQNHFARQGTTAEVVLYTIVGQGHAWPGSLQPFAGADPPSTEISATDTIWEFFRTHPKP
jgi:polyhydroxybutyrate depolymerase